MQLTFIVFSLAINYHSIYLIAQICFNGGFKTVEGWQFCICIDCIILQLNCNTFYHIITMTLKFYQSIYYLRYQIHIKGWSWLHNTCLQLYNSSIKAWVKTWFSCETVASLNMHHMLIAKSIWWMNICFVLMVRYFSMIIDEGAKGILFYRQIKTHFNIPYRFSNTINPLVLQIINVSHT